MITCEVCKQEIRRNQGKISQKGRIFKGGEEAYSDTLLHWHTNCFVKTEMNRPDLAKTIKGKGK